MLGPLCVGMSVFSLDWRDGDDAPGAGGKAHDLWKRLRAAVCREVREARSGRIAVNDSKRLKLANDWDAAPWKPIEPGARHPLVHLERGVLAFMSARADAGVSDPPDAIATDVALLNQLGAALEPHPWYDGDALTLPLACDRADLTLRANALRAALGAAGVRVLALRARVVGEAAFNDGCDRLGSKGAVNFGAAASLLAEVWSREETRVEPGADEGGPRVVFDRHGGRTSYGALLAGALRGVEVETLDEREAVSRYRVRSGAGGAPERVMTVIFQPKAEQAHLPVALASMVAKLVRELAMARFNRHFCSRAPSLAPTAGYVGDARRWLRDAAPTLSDAEKRALVRRQ